MADEYWPELGSFVKDYKPLAEGLSMVGVKLEQMNQDQLLAVIGFMMAHPEKLMDQRAFFLEHLLRSNIPIPSSIPVPSE